MRQSDITALCSCKLFAGLTNADIELFLSEMISNITCYKKHDTIFSPVCYKPSLAIILKGAADVHKQTKNGSLFLSVLTSGDMFGMAGLYYEGEGFINTVSARADCRVLFITKEQLQCVFIKYPVCVNNYITLLSQKIHYLNNKIQNLVSPSPSERLYNFLEAASESKNSNTFVLPVSFSELAGMLSMGRTSLYRAFDELCEKQLVKRNGKEICIINPKGK